MRYESSAYLYFLYAFYMILTFAYGREERREEKRRLYFHFLCVCFDFGLRLLHVIKAHAQLQRVISLRIYCNRLTEHCVNLCVKFASFFGYCCCSFLLLLLLLQQLENKLKIKALKDGRNYVCSGRNPLPKPKVDIHLPQSRHERGESSLPTFSALLLHIHNLSAATRVQL